MLKPFKTRAFWVVKKLLHSREKTQLIHALTTHKPIVSCQSKIVRRFFTGLTFYGAKSLKVPHPKVKHVIFWSKSIPVCLKK